MADMPPAESSPKPDEISQQLQAMRFYATDAELAAAQHRLLTLSYSTMLPSALFTTVALGIPNILAASASGAMTAGEIADHLPRQQESTEYVWRILRLLAGHDIFKQDGTDGPYSSKFSLTKESWLLTTGDPGRPSMAEYVLVQTSPVAMMAAMELKKAVEEGRGEPFSMVHGVNFWTYCRQNPIYGQQFGKSMTNISQEEMVQILNSFDGFGEKETLVDVAGSSGISGAAIRSKYPELKVIIFDLPEVIERAPKIDGVTYVAGDMFKEVPSGDQIFLKHILHDWSDSASIKILKNCYKALPANGKLIIADPVVPRPSNKSEKANRIKLLNIVMIVMCENGKERTETEWKDLLSAGGFKMTRVIATESGTVSVIEAAKEV